jgi:DNA-binding helix-hairpin-helix protein with protein kinase domain
MSFYGEHEDIVNPLRAEIGSLREELQRLRLDNEAKDREIEVLDKAAREVSRQNFLMRQQLQSWADEADGEIQLAKIRRSELEALEL